MSENEKTMESAPDMPNGSLRKGPRRGTILGMVLIGILLVGGVGGGAYLHEASRHETTDDAFLTADITQVAPQVSGTVTRVLVKDNQYVHAGDLLVQLNDDTYRTAVSQAQANLDVAIAQAQGAGISVALTNETGDAQIAQAQGGLAQVDSSISGANADLGRVDAGVAKANAGTREASASISIADAAVVVAQVNKEKAQAALQSADAQLATARANIGVAQAGVNAAAATASKTQRDAERYANLLAQGAISKSQADSAKAAADVAAAQLESARKGVEMAQDAVTAREADVASARKQIAAADAAIVQAQAQLLQTKEHLGSVQADVKQAKAQRQTAIDAISQAKAHRVQALGQLQQASTKPHQVALSASSRAQAQARIVQARAALQAARLQLKYTRIVAPVDGLVSNKTVAIGALVEPGTPLLALVQSDAVWVVANFKETQLAHIRSGQPVDIDVDAIDGRTYHGHVDSFSAATGATFALLPPDNATGNYTKVVQRVPIKITLDPGQPDADRLRSGLSVNVAVLVK